jgi:hypothetical protein
MIYSLISYLNSPPPPFSFIPPSPNSWNTFYRYGCKTKEMVSKLKGTPTEWEKILASYTSDKGLMNRIYRELKKLDSTKINDPMKKWGKELN